MATNKELIMTADTILRYITSTKYDTQMFQVLNIDDNDKPFFAIKEYQNQQYVYIKDSRISSKSDQLVKNKYYTIEVKWWIHDGIIHTKYCFVKTKSKCLFK